VLTAIHGRFELHPTKTRIVYCKDSNRRGEFEHITFDFLGYTFLGDPRTGKSCLPGRGGSTNGRDAVSVPPCIGWGVSRRNPTLFVLWTLGALPEAGS